MDLYLLSKTNGTIDSEAAAARPKPKPSGPTDKQIESRTTDGRRRITPIFIPPDAEESREDEDYNDGGIQTNHLKLHFQIKRYFPRVIISYLNMKQK